MAKEWVYDMVNLKSDFRMVNDLNTKGEQGWELVSIMHLPQVAKSMTIHDSEYFAILKMSKG